MSMKAIGRINRWFAERNYGFIQEFDNSGGPPRSHFLHAVNVISGTPATNAVVRFAPHLTSRGSTAIEVEVFANRQQMEHIDAAAALVKSAGLGDASAEASK